MRRTLAISLVFLFAWTFAAPLFAASDESSLPPCCRSNGKHHCMMRAMMAQRQTGPAVSTIGEKCRSLPKAVAVSQHRAWSTPPVQLTFAAALVHPSARAQTSARYRIAFSRSRQKRGPPVSA